MAIIGVGKYKIPSLEIGISSPKYGHVRSTMRQDKKLHDEAQNLANKQAFLVTYFAYKFQDLDKVQNIAKKGSNFFFGEISNLKISR